MEYVFGTKGDIEVLKTKSGGGTELTGFGQLVRETDVDATTDSFRVVKKLRRETDEAGAVYDFYEIDHHNRVIDKTGPIAEKTAEQAAQVAALEDAMCETDDANEAWKAELEDVVCEMDTAYETRITAIEDALCEMDGAE